MVPSLAGRRLSWLLGQARAQQSLRDYRISVIVVTREMPNFDQVSAEVGRIGDCVVRPVADVNLCTVNL